MGQTTGNVYRNRKRGTLYRVLHEARECTNSRDGLVVVVYASVDQPELIFVRERLEFLDKFEPL